MVSNGGRRDAPIIFYEPFVDKYRLNVDFNFIFVDFLLPL